MRNWLVLLVALADLWLTVSFSATTASKTRAHEIVASYEDSSSFRPLVANTHIQTIGGFFLRNTCSYLPTSNPWNYIFQQVLTGDDTSSDDDSFWDERECIETPDDDFFHVEYKHSESNDLVVILHGLESNSNSSLSIGIARAMSDSTVACINFRGCSGVPNRKLGGYHLGFTDDLEYFLKIKQKHYRNIYLVGFSLGANAVLKYLGTDSAQKNYQIKGAVALAAPLDQERNCDVLAQQPIYTNFLLSSLQRKARDQLQQHCENDPSTPFFDFPATQSARTITEFDNAFIAPIYGFTDATDYYRQTSSIHTLDRIRVPTLILNAKEDPFFDASVWPATASEAPIYWQRPTHGGHLGFLFQQTDDEQLIQARPQIPWVGFEMAKFLEHVHRETI